MSEHSKTIISKPHGNSGRIFTEDHKKRISLSKKGKRHTEETKRKLSEKLKGRTVFNKGKKLSKIHRKNIGLGGLGRKHSDETKKKMSEATKKRRSLSENKNKETGDKTALTYFNKKKTIPVIVHGVEYSSLSKAGKAYNISSSSVKHRCGSLNHYGWEFKDRDKIIKKENKQ